MKIRTILILAIVLSAMILVPMASANTPSGIGNPTLRVENGGSTSSAVIFADGITNGGSTGNGAIGWDIYLMVPGTVAINDFSVAAGSVWTSACPGTFNISKVSQTSTVVGKNAFLVSGVCLVPQTSVVTGDNVEVARLTFSSSCSATGTFDVDLDTGPQNDSTDMFDLLGEVYIFPGSALTDGGNLCGPTAVTMSGFDATTDSPAPFAAAAWPLLAGAAAVAAGGAYALLRRKS